MLQQTLTRAPDRIEILSSQTLAHNAMAGSNTLFPCQNNPKLSARFHNVGNSEIHALQLQLLAIRADTQLGRILHKLASFSFQQFAPCLDSRRT